MTETAAVVPNFVIPDAAATTDLEDWGELDEGTGPVMTTRGVTMWSGPDGAESGIWECTAGPSRWALETNEFVHVLSGTMTVTPDGGETFEAGPGSTFLVPQGWTGTWDIHSTLRKLYVIF